MTHCTNDTATLDRQAASAADGATPGVFALVGNPNVGKSVVFHRLTGTYVNVSNYPGTTVDVSRASARFERGAEVLDTPGVLALPARSDDEHATMRALLHENLRALVQVGDAKNLRRTLALSLVFADLGLPWVLALNMADEARARGVGVDLQGLSKAIGAPVIETVATSGEGLQRLPEALKHAYASQGPAHRFRYPDAVEAVVMQAADWITARLPKTPLAPRGLAVLFLGRDAEVERWLAAHLGAEAQQLIALREAAESASPEPLSTALAQARAAEADRLAGAYLRKEVPKAKLLSTRLGRLAVHRIWGLPILLLVLFAVYEFVGVFGASFLVGLTEKNLFGEILNPAMEGFVRAHVPWQWVADLMVGQYGLWTMGMTYALALILPIVTTFFLAFGVLEDSGYFSRLSVLANRAFSLIGLNGRAVLPMVLGLGCVTMATLTTRILHTKRERVISTFLLALAIPCSAQLGVVMGMLSGISFSATLIWLSSVVLILLTSGWLAAKLIPGRRIPLVTEMPPMRLPVIGNVMKKTAGRLKWYLVEVIPLFLFGTLLMFVLDRVGALPWIIEKGEPLVTGWLGLPKEASAAFVMGFLRRDFGATGLFALGHQLSPLQTVVGMITITLFVPCIASVMIVIKEQGGKIAAAMLGLIMPTAFLVGGIFNMILKHFW
ncbi:ferrous iron transport protein B [Niveibacterium microcysteis]|uniref:Ferrous iron transport protein B n=1 Tax=Niveibacterium microcysteis TaxID=2811415 RepID=A0ABX7M851_9RHOO|nr:ferrous iron transport protein B [Niveibacterium microcysteis]QSI75662.1 ferrous iron transport protein B [Niveibacterium microcysteis]